MSTNAQIHVISKANVKEHAVVPLSASSLPQLQDGHVRLRTALISLTSNNYSYALLGTLRHWWDTYPVPEGLSAPYNDSTQYGIVPAWGYGEVLESKASGIDAGMLLWGYWPTHDLPIDLKLVPADAAGHYIETSESRQRLMTLYQRYILLDPTARMDPLDQSKMEEMALETAVRPVWEAGYLLNAAIFGDPPIHPLGTGKWDEKDADLTSAVVVSLSASGKTARGFTDGLINHRSQNRAPLGFLAIASRFNKDLTSKAPFPTSAVTYETMTNAETLSWIERQKPSKLVIVDFGGRGDSLHRLLETFDKRFSGVEVVVIGVGGNVEMSTTQELGKWAQKNMALANRVQMNTSDIRDAAMERDGAEAYFKDVMEAWGKFVQRGSASDFKLEIGQGVAGSNGFEGGWTRLCEGKVIGDLALAYRF